VEYRTIRLKKASIEAWCLPLLEKNLIVLKGAKGYIMCGYLDMQAAEKCNDLAAQIKGVSTIAHALRARLCACTSKARAQGLYEGQAVKDALRVIA